SFTCRGVLLVYLSRGQTRSVLGEQTKMPTTNRCGAARARQKSRIGRQVRYAAGTAGTARTTDRKTFESLTARSTSAPRHRAIIPTAGRIISRTGGSLITRA